jgi:hypothetical protein
MKRENQVKQKKHHPFSMKVCLLIIFAVSLSSVGFLYAKNQDIQYKRKSQKKPLDLAATTPTPTSIQAKTNTNNQGGDYILDYYDYCNREDTQVWRSELQEYKFNDKSYWITSEDLQCIERDRNSTTMNQTSEKSTQSQPAIAPSTSSYKAATFPCNVYDPSKETSVYIGEYTYSDCLGWINWYFEINKPFNPDPIKFVSPAPTFTPTPIKIKTCKTPGWNGSCIEWNE